MAGLGKISSLPAKVSRAKAAKSTTATKSSLSSEFVVDSDESEDAETAEVKKPASKTAKSTSNSVQRAASDSSTSQARPSKKRKSPVPSSEEHDSSDSGTGNDSSSQDAKISSKNDNVAARGGSFTPKPIPAVARPVLAKSSIKPSTSVKPLDQRKEHRLGATRNESKSETGGSSEDSSSTSESGSGSESESGSSDKTSLQSPRKKSPIQKSVSRQPTSAYAPPDGFESTSISVHPASKLSEVLAPSNLQGKQIWHITAPASVPISLVKELSTQNIGSGASILEYHGAKYGFVPESDTEQASSRTLLLPSTQTSSYQSSKTTIIKTVHLQRLVSLPSHALKPAVRHSYSTSVSDPYRRTPRQQPEGLRMRYRPFGVADDSDMESSPEHMPKVPEFRTPAAVKESSPGKKRKRFESNDGNTNTFSPTKSKKRKQSPQATAGAIEYPIDIDAISDKRSNGTESPTKSPHPETNAVMSNGNLPDGNETKEERRKRKEKKKFEQRESPSKPATALPLDVKRDAETMQPGEVIEGASAVGNAVEGTASTNVISPQDESQDEKAKRKEERRRRRRMEKASKGASLKSAEDISQREVADSQDRMMQEIEDAQRDASIQIPVAKDSSPRNESRIVHESQNSVLDSSQTSQSKETKEERAKRKEEKRRRKMERGSA